MAAKIRGVDEKTTPSPSKESLMLNELFIPEDSLDQPCDVVLVVEDGKEFKAHRKVLSEASPFFEKMLNSNMKESKEGVVRLEMFSESVTATTLEFIYTGHVQILAEEIARDLIVMADYLFLQELKTLVEGVLEQKLNISDCISTYYFSDRYHCEVLLSKTQKFILANFTAVYAANREEVLNMSNKEFEMWISSDEIDVSAEEEVFKIILAWIDHDITERKKYFAELFSHVRLVYASRDYLSCDIVANDLVKENEGCLNLVKDAMNLIDFKNCASLSFPPRNSLETQPAIVISNGAEFVCYFPDEDRWCKLADIPSEYSNFDPYTNRWMQLPPLKNRYFRRVFVGNGDTLYALLCDVCFPVGDVAIGYRIRKLCESQHTLFISKYKPESHSWEDIASFNHFRPNARSQYCIVASDHFIYFIGGEQVQYGEFHRKIVKRTAMSNVDRYDLSKNQWDKVADIQRARSDACGAVTNGKIFIAGGLDQCGIWRFIGCEMYNETTNEWQYIALIKKTWDFKNLLAANGKLYAVCQNLERRGGYLCLQERSVECYNPEKIP
ncbi:kelch-like protein 40, partial [Oculina patagonica]